MSSKYSFIEIKKTRVNLKIGYITKDWEGVFVQTDMSEIKGKICQART